MATTKISTKQTEENIPLDVQLATKRAELLEAQRGLGSTLQNPHILKKIRKEIARIMTKINNQSPEAELTSVSGKETQDGKGK